jgi:predicted phosphodiesterase
MKNRAILEQYFKQYNAKSDVKGATERIWKVHKKEFGFGKQTLYRYLLNIKRENEEVVEVNTKPLWSIKGKDYTWMDRNKKSKQYSIEFIDNLFLYYSRKGYNFSRTRLCNRFDLGIRAFNEIQRVFFLYKDSNILSPHTVATTPNAELQVIMEEQMGKVLRSGEIAEQKYTDSVVKEYRKSINKDNKQKLMIEEMFHELSIELPKINRNQLKVHKCDNKFELIVTIADLHIGAKNHEVLYKTESYSVEIAREKLARIVSIINKYKALKVHVNLLGDLVESISGLNHPDTWKGMEVGMFGFPAIVKAFELILQTLDGIENLASVNGVAGNHDRSAKSNLESDTLATDAIFYMLKTYYSKTDVKVNYDPVILSLSIDGLGYILGHGNLGIHKNSVSDIILNFAVDPKEYQLIMLGHLHTLMVERGNDTMNGRKVTCPSIFTGNRYSDSDLGVSCKSGVVFSFKDAFGEPVMTIHSC